MTDVGIAAALRGNAGAAPSRDDWPALIASAGDEGVLPLLADAAVAARWDERLLAAMRPHLAAETALAMLRERELRRVLDVLAASDVVPLLLKGAHLAFTVYPSPDRRPRVDTDLLIRDRDRDAARRALTTLGYEPLPKVTGEVAFAQFQVWRTDDSGATHTIDVHWRIANPKAFADRMAYDELMHDAVPIPRLGVNAFGPSPAWALLIACLHRTAHHGTSTRLIWLYDIHLLAAALNADEWQRVADVAERRSLAPVVAAGLEHSATRLGTMVPSRILERLRAGEPVTDADVLEFLKGEPARIQIAMSDWKRIPDWRQRARFLQDHLFPSPAYIEHRYGVSSPAALPFLYAHRIVTGAFKWLVERRD